tara:strand:- start:273 stop:1346 length:1074 start_codon:yes stop_codon:yes gene_type:complete
MSDIFGSYDLSSMNESDVREIIVRPLLGLLGYSQGNAKARILSEKTLTYDKFFLGRKNPNKDPKLVGRADYICEVTSYGRWVVEVKSPMQKLNTEDAYQAHTYAAHPEVAGLFSLITNGHEFRIYQISDPSKPIVTWGISEINERLPMLINLLGVESIKRRVAVKTDLGKPIAPGWGSSVRVVGGTVRYQKPTSTNPMLQGNDFPMEGAQAAVTGSKVFRNQEGRIEGNITMNGPYSYWDDLNKAAGLDSFTFVTPDEFVSPNVEHPSIFQNHVDARLVKGVEFLMPDGKKTSLPWTIEMSINTEAVGYLDNDRFKGTFSNDYVVKVAKPYGTFEPPLEIREFEMRIAGQFEILLTH